MFSVCPPRGGEGRTPLPSHNTSSSLRSFLGGGYPSPRWEGIPVPGRGYPSLKWMYPCPEVPDWPGQDMVPLPLQTGQDGVLHLPPSPRPRRGRGTPSQDRMGTPPPHGTDSMGYPPPQPGQNRMGSPPPWDRLRLDRLRRGEYASCSFPQKDCLVFKLRTSQMFMNFWQGGGVCVRYLWVSEFVNS